MKKYSLLIVLTIIMSILCGCGKIEKYQPVTQQNTTVSQDSTEDTSTEQSTEAVSDNSATTENLEEENKCEHLWTQTLRNDAETHLIVCDACGEELTTESHQWGELNQYSNTTMAQVCEYCGEVKETVISDFDQYGYSPKYHVTNPQVIYMKFVVDREPIDQSYNWDNYKKCTVSYLRPEIDLILDTNSYYYIDDHDENETTAEEPAE